jgi:hypothetical protein
MTDNDLNKPYESIPLDAIVTIEVSGGFYASIQNLFYQVLQEKAVDDPTGYNTAKILEDMENREPKNKWEQEIVLLFSLMNSIEAAAKKQNKTKMETIDNIMDLIPDINPESSPEN